MSCSDHDIFLSTALGRGVHAAVEDALAGPSDRATLAVIGAVELCVACGPVLEEEVFASLDGSCCGGKDSCGGLEARAENGVCWFDMLMDESGLE